MEIEMGAEVYALDGRLGVVEEVVLDPESRMSYLVVGSGLFAHRARRVPRELIAEVTPHQVHLRLRLKEAQALPEHHETHYKRPEEDPFGRVMPTGVFWPSQMVGWMQPDEEIASGSAAIAEGTEVYCSDGSVGHVEEVLVDEETGAATAMVVRRGFFFHRTFTAPMEWVESVSSDRVKLRLSKRELGELTQS